MFLTWVKTGMDLSFFVPCQCRGNHTNQFVDRQRGETISWEYLSFPKVIQTAALSKNHTRQNKRCHVYEFLTGLRLLLTGLNFDQNLRRRGCNFFDKTLFRAYGGSTPNLH